MADPVAGTARQNMCTKGVSVGALCAAGRDKRGRNAKNAFLLCLQSARPAQACAHAGLSGRRVLLREVESLDRAVRAVVESLDRAVRDVVYGAPPPAAPQKCVFLRQEMIRKRERCAPLGSRPSASKNKHNFFFSLCLRRLPPCPPRGDPARAKRHTHLETSATNDRHPGPHVAQGEVGRAGARGGEKGETAEKKGGRKTGEQKKTRRGKMGESLPTARMCPPETPRPPAWAYH